jgi:septal ring factor EnvC (AmiA/AmiB activator)
VALFASIAGQFPSHADPADSAPSAILAPSAAWNLPALPKASELRSSDVSRCIGAYWDAPRRLQDLDSFRSTLVAKSDALRIEDERLSEARNKLDGEDRDLAQASDRLGTEDAALEASRLEIRRLNSSGVSSKAQATRFKKQVDLFNDRVARRNRDAEALRARLTSRAERVDHFNARVVKFTTVVERFREQIAEYESQAQSLTSDFAKFEAACAGERTIVR